MSTKPAPKPGRPVRPSVARKDEAARQAAKLERTSARLVVETNSTVLREVRLRAAEKGITVRAFVLQAIGESGVRSALEDIEHR